uniref:Peptidase M14 domain-containing protein n=1 Tax=Odontella aurita TaxID=265563 RepID=A0A7S4HR62_9STRA
MFDIAAKYPAIAELVDMGDSYHKIARVGKGWDLWVLKLTNRARPGGYDRKGIFFSMFGLHAREYAPPEIGTRMAEYVVQNYGRDADVTALLDNNELHLLLLANPDGREIAQDNRSAWWRKNTNFGPNADGRYCGNQFEDGGVDLNRNFDFMWGDDVGSSSDPCESDFRGSRAFSEPESRAVGDYAREIFPSSQFRSDPEGRSSIRRERNTDASVGLFVDVHAYGELVISPWGFIDERIPPQNYAAYRALSHKMCWFNGYKPSASGNKNFLYEVSGGGTDYTWGNLGVPSILFEVGTSFYPTCDKFLDKIYPRNLRALLYSASVSSRPLFIAKGPDVLELKLQPRRVGPRGEMTVTARVSDDKWSDDIRDAEGRVPSAGQRIEEVRLYVDEYPDYIDTNKNVRNNVPSSVIRMEKRRSSGTGGGSFFFSSSNEIAVAKVTASTLTRGRHMLCVAAVDAMGYVGSMKCEYFGVGCHPNDCGDGEEDGDGDGEDDECSALKKKFQCRKNEGCAWERLARPRGGVTRKKCVKANAAAAAAATATATRDRI